MIDANLHRERYAWEQGRYQLVSAAIIVCIAFTAQKEEDLDVRSTDSLLATRQHYPVLVAIHGTYLH